MTKFVRSAIFEIIVTCNRERYLKVKAGKTASKKHISNSISSLGIALIYKVADIWWIFFGTNTAVNVEVVCASKDNFSEFDRL